MPRYQKVDYNKIGLMIRVHVAMRGEPLSLREVVADMSKKLHLGLDTHRVQAVLGDKVVEKCEYVDGVMRVTTLVVV
jgi:hypothetical protein